MAKIIIDLEERLEEYVDNYINIGGCDEERKKPLYCYPDRLVKTIKDGIVLSGKVTNGEVIKALFPSAEVFETDGFGYEYIYVTVDKSSSSWKIQREWWDSPYKEAEDGTNEK